MVVIGGSVGGSETRRRTTHAARLRSKNQPKYYVVQPGDTFGGIAAKEGVSVARLEELNPNLDTQLLPEKGCVDLVPEGVQGARERRLSQAARRPSGLRLRSRCAVLALWPARAAASQPQPPEIPARAWILVDADDGTRLAAHDPDELAADGQHHEADDRLPGPPRAAARRSAWSRPPYHPIPGESLLGLEPGERISVRDLLYGLLLPSGNDAAVTLADGVAGSTAAFVDEMNRAARRLGLRDTSYANPIGLDARATTRAPATSRSSRSTCAATRCSGGSSNTPQTTLRTGDHPRTIVNHNDLWSPMPWINGVKTGYTPDAGNVLVGSGTRKGVTLLSVVMGAPSIPARDGDTLALLRYGFSLYSRRQAVRPGAAARTARGARTRRARSARARRAAAVQPCGAASTSM